MLRTSASVELSYLELQELESLLSARLNGQIKRGVLSSRYLDLLGKIRAASLEIEECTLWHVQQFSQKLK